MKKRQSQAWNHTLWLGAPNQHVHYLLLQGPHGLGIQGMCSGTGTLPGMGPEVTLHSTFLKSIFLKAYRLCN